ncbi:MAG: hypothetical protein K9J79_08965 [Desulfobacteraceae bacterium]|nr:hypothetical protein [Desulfobacteraceae bacterium]
MSKLFGIWLLLAFFVASPAAAYTQKDCIACHGNEGSMSRLVIPAEKFRESVHADLTCMGCHTRIIDESHQTGSGAAGVDCSGCHGIENFHGAQSHKDRPECDDCHGRHSIKPPGDPESGVNADRLDQTCRKCHPSESGQNDFLSWLPSLKISSHKKQDMSRDYSGKNCIGCHQAKAVHGGDEQISKDNCGMCHKDGALMGSIHPEADPRTQPGVFAAGIIYQIVLAVLVLGGIAYFIRLFSARSK